MVSTVNPRSGAARAGVDILQLVESLGVEIVSTSDEGERWATARCAFHDDHNPSFAVSAEHGGWLCRAGCGSGRLPLLISLLNPEMDESTAERWVDRFTVDSAFLERVVSRVRTATPAPRPAPPFDYEHGHTHPLMLERGFELVTLKAWDIGWNPERRAIVIPVDFNRQRLGLIYRSVGGSAPKYLYTPGLHKSHLLFGWDKLPADPPYVVVVEGSLDAIWLYQAGEPGVAVLGAILSAAQADLLTARTRTVVLGFDSDQAGRDGTEKALKLMRNYRNINCRTVTWPEGVKDAQELALDLINPTIREAGLR